MHETMEAYLFNDLRFSSYGHRYSSECAKGRVKKVDHEYGNATL